jgi:hypothetical protein
MRKYIHNNEKFLTGMGYGMSEINSNFVRKETGQIVR